MSRVGHLPEEHTCNGKGGNPPLNIAACPEATKTLAPIAEDPDAPSAP